MSSSANEVATISLLEAQKNDLLNTLVRQKRAQTQRRSRTLQHYNTKINFAVQDIKWKKDRGQKISEAKKIWLENSRKNKNSKTS